MGRLASLEGCRRKSTNIRSHWRSAAGRQTTRTTRAEQVRDQANVALTAAPTDTDLAEPDLDALFAHPALEVESPRTMLRALDDAVT
ncbi:MAG: hypothetical protein Q8L76_08715, partial [Cypionkella sp.]|nr:hypothetical protein [Cypionkella sp.]